jgi:cytochrome P450
MNNESKCPMMKVVELNRTPSPWAELRAVLADGGVARSEEYGGFWTVLGYDEVKRVALDTTSFTTREGATVPRVGAGVPALPTELDPPDHIVYRRLLVGPLRPDRVEELAPSVRSLTRRLLEELATSDAPDLITGLARRIPPRVIAEVMGLPVEDAERLVDLSHAIDQAAGAQDPERNRQAAVDLIDYIGAIVDTARSSPSDSLVSRIANAEIDAQPIAHESAVGLLLTLILAGHSTTINGIGSTLWLLAREPGLKAALVADPGLVPAAVEEALRLESPIPMMARTATCPARAGHQEVDEGEKVGLMWGAANHDPAHFDDPDAFRLDRGRNAHLAFGHGVHKCVGEHLARMEIRVVVEEVLARIPDYRIDGEVTFGGPGLPSHNRGLASLPVALS